MSKFPSHLEFPMYMIQLLLPLWSNGGERFSQPLFEHVRDDVVVYEVMVQNLDENWWSSYRKALEQRFSRDKLVIRAQEIRLL